MNLGAYLKKRGETRAAFAARIEAHPVSVSKWITGGLKPSWPVMARIAEATGGEVTALDFAAAVTPTAAPAQPEPTPAEARPAA